MPTPKKRTTRKAQKQSPLGDRVEHAMRAAELSKSAVAARIGKGWTTTRVTETMSESPKGPTAQSICDMADALGTTTDFLLLGRGPMRPLRQRDDTQLGDDLAAEVRRRLYERLRWPGAGGDSRFDALRPEHLQIDSEALINVLISETERQFRAEADRALFEANRNRITGMQGAVIRALTRALPLSESRAGVAARAANTLELDALVSSVNLSETGPVSLSDDGVEALVQWWEYPDAAEATRILLKYSQSRTFTSDHGRR